MARLPVGVQLLGRPPAALLSKVARGLELAGADSFFTPDHWMWLAPLGLWNRRDFPAARQAYEKYLTVATDAKDLDAVKKKIAGLPTHSGKSRASKSH